MSDFMLKATSTGAYLVLYAMTQEAHAWVKEYRHEAVSSTEYCNRLEDLVTNYMMPVPLEERDQIIAAIVKEGLTVEVGEKLFGRDRAA